MVDLILSHGFDFGLLGLGYFAIHRILSKKARELQFSFSLQNGIKFSCFLGKNNPKSIRR